MPEEGVRLECPVSKVIIYHFTAGLLKYCSSSVIKNAFFSIFFYSYSSFLAHLHNSTGKCWIFQYNIVMEKALWNVYTGRQNLFCHFVLTYGCMVYLFLVVLT